MGKMTVELEMLCGCRFEHTARWSDVTPLPAITMATSTVKEAYRKKADEHQCPKQEEASA